MKSLKEATEQLQIEINNKKRDLAILKTDQIMRDLTIDDLADFHNTTHNREKNYFHVYPRVPLRLSSSKLMTKCIGNSNYIDEQKIITNKRKAVIYFKKKWLEMRKEFEILKDFS